MKRKKTQVSGKKEQLKEKIGMSLAVIVLFVCGLGLWGVLGVFLVQEFSDFANAPFYSGLSEHFRDASFADFVPVILFTCVCVILIFLMFWRRYRPTSQPYDGIPSPHMHPAVASYAMRGGFFDPNRIIALTITRLVHQEILVVSDGKYVWDKKWKESLGDKQLGDIDYAAMQFLERIYFYTGKEGKRKSALLPVEIRDFSYTDRKIYSDLVTDIKQAFSTQCAREGVKENHGNLLTAFTFMWIVVFGVVGIGTAFISAFLFADSSFLGGATVFVYALSFVFFALLFFLCALVALLSGMPWDYRAGRQGAGFYKAIRSSSFPEITNDTYERWAGLTIVDEKNGRYPFEYVQNGCESTVDARAIYESLPVIGTKQWLSPLNRWAQLFFRIAQKVRNTLRDLWGSGRVTVDGFLGVAAVFALSGVAFLLPELLAQDTRDTAKNIEWDADNSSWQDWIFSSDVFRIVVVPILVAILLFILARFLYFLVNYGRLAFSRSQGKYSREIPDIHPATASFVADGGIFRIKHVLSSSLLRLVSLGIFTIEKRENEYGDSTFVLMRTHKNDSKLTKIDEATLRLVNFVIADRYKQRLRARAEELERYELSAQVKGVVFLEDFPVVSKKERKKYKEHIKEIIEAVNEDLEKHNFLSKSLNTVIDIAFELYGVFLHFLMPILYQFIVLDGAPMNGVGYVSGLVTMYWISSLIWMPFVFIRIFEKTFLGYNYLSRTGISMWKDLRGLRRWLEDYTLLEERDVLSVKVWEEYMVYAAALGLPARVYGDFAQAIEVADDAYSDLAKDLAETL